MAPSQLPAARAEEKYVSNTSENWVFIPFSLGLRSFLGKTRRESAVKHQLKLAEVFLMPQTCPGITSTSSMAVNTTLCAMTIDRYGQFLAWESQGNTMKRSENVCLPVYTQRSQIIITRNHRCGSWRELCSPWHKGHAALLHCKALLGLGDQTPHPIKIHRSPVPPLQGGWQGDGSWPPGTSPHDGTVGASATRGNLLFPSHPGSLIAANIKIPSFHRHVECALCSYHSALQPI